MPADRPLEAQLLVRAGRLLLEYNESSGAILRALTTTARIFTDEPCHVALSYRGIAVSFEGGSPILETVPELRYNAIVQTRVHEVLDRVRRGQLDELARQIESARNQRPDWRAGDFLLAMVLCRSGRYDEARSIVQKLADPRLEDENLTNSIYPMYAYADLVAELESHAEVADLVPAVYERSAGLPNTMIYLRYGLDQHPAPVGRAIRQDVHGVEHKI